MADNKLRTISWNVKGLKKRSGKVHCYVHKHNVDVILLQKTGDRNGDLFKHNGFTKYQLLAGEGTKGLATYIKNFHPLRAD